MTRSGEKLAGDREARIVATAKPIPWSKLVHRGVMVAAIAVVGISAIYGFS